MDKIKIGGVMKHTHLSEIGVKGIPSRPGTAATVLGTLGEARINVQFVVHCVGNNGRDNIVFCVGHDDLAASLEIIDRLKEAVKAESVTHQPDVATIAIFGPDFRERPGIAGTMFKALAAREINILAISTSISTVSCVIAADRLDDAIAAMYDAFDLP
ncbi:MAG: ACT domain-containing protein [Anaerolineae bacterium]|nr:ACT domain-containing protein [Anaerolineae bacterium]